MFYQVSLDDLVPSNNFYRRTQENLNLSFLYKATAQFYGSEGQESSDPIVFFKDAALLKNLVVSCLVRFLIVLANCVGYFLGNSDFIL
jgi:hypothetical protein